MRGPSLGAYMVSTADVGFGLWVWGCRRAGFTVAGFRVARVQEKDFAWKAWVSKHMYLQR